jgi:hypothetical protein
MLLEYFANLNKDTSDDNDRIASLSTGDDIPDSQEYLDSDDLKAHRQKY